MLRSNTRMVGKLKGILTSRSIVGSDYVLLIVLLWYGPP